MNLKNTIKFQLSKFGGAMLIPIVAMPAAGLLSRFGRPDLLDMQVLRIASSVIFGNLDLLFAVGVVLAFTKTKDRAIPVLAAILSLMIFKEGLTYFNDELSMGVFGGIVTGGLTTYIYEKTRFWKVPRAFTLFAGEKFVLLMSPLIMIPYAYLFSLIWYPIQQGLDSFALWLGAAGMVGVFIFGFLNRLLIPTGLHHVLNSYIFWELGTYISADGTEVSGEMARFLAGDPTAGSFTAMFFVVMIFGLPGACLGMYSAADKDKKDEAKGLFSSGAITAILSGITEPIEFSFMFTSPALYVVHAFLTGLAGSILFIFNAKLGQSFGFNIFDFVLNWSLGTNVIFILMLGIVYFCLYCILFRTIILKFNLQTPGRKTFIESDEVNEKEFTTTSGSKDYHYMSKQILKYIGGESNVVSFTNCVTRLRLELKDTDLVDVERIKQLNVLGIVKLSKENIQVIIGTDVRNVAEAFDSQLLLARSNAKNMSTN